MNERRKKRSVIRIIAYVFLFLITCVVLGSIIRSLKAPVQRKPQSSEQEWALKSYGYAPHPDDFEEAIIQVYAARTRGAKKALAVHTWIATKRKGADQYIISQVFGWRLRPGGTALFREPGIPDKSWARNEPSLLLDLRGEEAELLIDKVEQAISKYPWHDVYTAWPGPNSNTFLAWIGLQVPELRLDLPATAIGKDWRPISEIFGKSASGTGLQCSLYGLLGITAGYEEGIEVNIAGLSIELDIFDLALELPGIGRVW
ncbi:MAG: DUF3750 domain-containing protein [Cyclobacteriaceae bacterium]|nr:DUF3750 domain-containing protein [Cyclobacteriaceae bacterium]